MTFQHSIVNNISIAGSVCAPRDDRFQDIIDLYSALTDAQINEYWPTGGHERKVMERSGCPTVYEGVRIVPELIAKGEYEKAANIMGCRKNTSIAGCDMKGLWERIKGAAE